MDNNFNSFNPVSGADSASVQEQLVKGSLSSSNFNNASKREQSSSLELPSVSIFGSANIVDELEEVDLIRNRRVRATRNKNNRFVDISQYACR